MTAASEGHGTVWGRGSVVFGVAAFLVLGFTVGSLAGLTSAAVTLPLVAALFAFGGTSAIAFVGKVKATDRIMGIGAIFGLALGCLLGVYSGIHVREYRLLSPPEESTSTAGDRILRRESDPTGYMNWLAGPDTAAIEARRYSDVPLELLYSVSQSMRARTDTIDKLARTGRIPYQAAYDSLRHLFVRPPPGKQ